MGQSVSSTSGQQLEERYFLQKVKLGQGSFGTVWRAVDRKSSDIVAIKQLDKASLPRRGVTRQDIEREIHMMQACPHENITQLFDHFENDTSIFLALEYCDGGDFGDKVKEKGMGVSEAEVAEWMHQMCAAICAMHCRAICHRDIKPDNFMVSNNAAIKLSDFGLACHLPKGTLLQVKCGTPAFMSPEQHRLPRSSAGYGFPADMWAVGVSMYMMMFGGKHPFLNDRGGLDDHLLLTGELDFKDTNGKALGFFGGLAGLGGASMRFSEEARSFCKRMVEPDVGRRLSAEETPSIPWLRNGAAAAKEGARPRGGGARSATPPLASPELREERPSGTPRSTPPPRGAPEQSPTSEEASAGRRQRARTPPQAEHAGAATPFRPADRARTPGPEGRKALEEAAKLAMANKALQSELEERKEQLAQQQKRMEMQQKLFHKQRTKELEEIEKNKMQQEQEMLTIRTQKKQLELQLAKRAAAVAAAAAGGANSTHAPAVAGSASGAKPLAAAAGMAYGGGKGKLLRAGTRCRYESGTYGWMDAVVQTYNDSDGTYNLDVRQHAAADKIAPAKDDVGEREAWPPGTMAAYLSASVNTWLPAVVSSFNETDGTYNLDVRDHADVDRIRARGDKPPEESSGPPRPTIRPGGAQETQLGTNGEPSSTSSASRPSRVRPLDGGGAASRTSIDGGGDGADSRKPRVATGDMEATTTTSPSPGSSPAPRWVNKGDVCTIPEHGLVVIESSVGRDGCYTVKASEKTRMQVLPEVMRAPREAKFAWGPGTKVSYLSASVGKWIDASVLSFNPSGGTYNLDVRPEADPDKVRPR